MIELFDKAFNMEVKTLLLWSIFLFYSGNGSSDIKGHHIRDTRWKHRPEQFHENDQPIHKLNSQTLDSSSESATNIETGQINSENDFYYRVTKYHSIIDVNSNKNGDPFQRVGNGERKLNKREATFKAKIWPSVENPTSDEDSRIGYTVETSEKIKYLVSTPVGFFLNIGSVKNTSKVTEDQLDNSLLQSTNKALDRGRNKLSTLNKGKKMLFQNRDRTNHKTLLFKRADEREFTQNRPWISNKFLRFYFLKKANASIFGLDVSRIPTADQDSNKQISLSNDGVHRRKRSVFSVTSDTGLHATNYIRKTDDNTMTSKSNDFNLHTSTPINPSSENESTVSSVSNAYLNLKDSHDSSSSFEPLSTKAETAEDNRVNPLEATSPVTFTSDSLGSSSSSSSPTYSSFPFSSSSSSSSSSFSSSSSLSTNTPLSSPFRDTTVTGLASQTSSPTADFSVSELGLSSKQSQVTSSSSSSQLLNTISAINLSKNASRVVMITDPIIQQTDSLELPAESPSYDQFTNAMTPSSEDASLSSSLTTEPSLLTPLLTSTSASILLPTPPLSNQLQKSTAKITTIDTEILTTNTSLTTRGFSPKSEIKTIASIPSTDHKSTATETHLNKTSIEPDFVPSTNTVVIAGESSSSEPVTIAYSKETQTAGISIADFQSQATDLFDQADDTASRSSSFVSSFTKKTIELLTMEKSLSTEISTDDSIYSVTTRPCNNELETSSPSLATTIAGENNIQSSTVNNPISSSEIFTISSDTETATDFTKQKSLLTTYDLKSTDLETNTVISSYSPGSETSTSREVSTKIRNNPTEMLTLAATDEHQITTTSVRAQSVAYKDTIIESSTLTSDVRTDRVNEVQPSTDDSIETSIGEQKKPKSILSYSDVPMKTDLITEFTTKEMIPTSTNRFSTQTSKETKEFSVNDDNDNWTTSTQLTVDDLSDAPVITTWDDRTSVDHSKLFMSSESQTKGKGDNQIQTTEQYTTIKNLAETIPHSMNERTAYIANMESPLDPQTTESTFVGIQTSEKLNRKYAYETTPSVISQTASDLVTGEIGGHSRQSNSFTNGTISPRNSSISRVTENTSPIPQFLETTEAAETIKFGTKATKSLNESDITVSNSPVTLPSSTDQFRDDISHANDMSTIAVSMNDDSLIKTLSNHRDDSVSISVTGVAISASLSATAMSRLTTKNEMFDTENSSSLRGSNSGKQIEILSTHTFERTESEGKATVTDSSEPSKTTQNTFPQKDGKTESFETSSIANIIRVTSDYRNMSFMDRPTTISQPVGATEEEPLKNPGLPAITKNSFLSSLLMENPSTSSIETERSKGTTEKFLMSSSLSNLPKTSLKTEWSMTQEAIKAKHTSTDNQENPASTIESGREIKSSGSTLSFISDQTVSSQFNAGMTSGASSYTSANDPDDLTTKTTSAQSITIRYAANTSFEQLAFSSPPPITEIPVTTLRTAIVGETTSDNTVVISSESKVLLQSNAAVRNTVAPAKTFSAYETTASFSSESSTKIDAQTISSSTQTFLTTVLAASDLQEDTRQTSPENTNSLRNSFDFHSTQRNENNSQVTFFSSLVKSTIDEENSITKVFTFKPLVKTRSEQLPTSPLMVSQNVNAFNPAMTVYTPGIEEEITNQRPTIATTKRGEPVTTNIISSAVHRVNMAGGKQTTMSAKESNSGIIVNTADESNTISSSINRTQSMSKNEVTELASKATSSNLQSTIILTDPDGTTENIYQEKSSYNIKTAPVTTDSSASVATIKGSTLSESNHKTMSNTAPTTVGVAYVEFNGVVRITNGLKWSSNLATKNTEEFKQAEACVRNMLINALHESSISNRFVDVQIIGFREGSVKVDFVLILKDQSTASNNSSTNGTSNIDLERNSKNLMTTSLQTALLDALKKSNLTENLTIDFNNTKINGKIQTTEWSTKIFTTVSFFDPTFSEKIATAEKSVLENTTALQIATITLLDTVSTGVTGSSSLSTVNTSLTNKSSSSSSSISTIKTTSATATTATEPRSSKQVNYDGNITSTDPNTADSKIRETSMDGMTVSKEALNEILSTTIKPFSPTTDYTTIHSDSTAAANHETSQRHDDITNGYSEATLNSLSISTNARNESDTTQNYQTLSDTLGSTSVTPDTTSTPIENRNWLVSTQLTTETHSTTNKQGDIKFTTTTEFLNITSDVSTFSASSLPCPTSISNQLSSENTSNDIISTLSSSTPLIGDVTLRIVSDSQIRPSWSTQIFFETPVFSDYLASNISDEIVQSSFSTTSTSMWITPTETMAVQSSTTDIGTKEWNSAFYSDLITSTRIIGSSGNPENVISTSWYQTAKMEDASAALFQSDTVSIVKAGSDIISASMSSSSSSIFTMATPIAARGHHGFIKLTSGVQWQVELSSNSSEQYKILESKMLKFLRKVFENGPLRNSIKSIKINKFRKGSVIVDFDVELTNTSMNASNVKNVFWKSYTNITNVEFAVTMDNVVFNDTAVPTSLSSMSGGETVVNNLDVISVPWSSTQQLQPSSSPVKVPEMPISTFTEHTLHFTHLTLSYTTDISSKTLQSSSIFLLPSVLMSSEFIPGDVTKSTQEISMIGTETTSYFSQLLPTTPLASSSPEPDTSNFLTSLFSSILVSTVIADSSSFTISRSNPAASDSLLSSAFVDSSFLLTDSYFSSVNDRSVHSETPSNEFSSQYITLVTNLSPASYSQVSEESSMINILPPFPSSSEYVSTVSSLFEFQIRNTTSWPSNSLNDYSPISASASSATQSKQASKTQTPFMESNSELFELSTKWTLSVITASNTISDIDSTFASNVFDKTFPTILEISTDFLLTSRTTALNDMSSSMPESQAVNVTSLSPTSSFNNDVPASTDFTTGPHVTSARDILNITSRTNLLTSLVPESSSSSNVDSSNRLQSNWNETATTFSDIFASPFQHQYTSAQITSTLIGDSSSSLFQSTLDNNNQNSDSDWLSTLITTPSTSLQLASSYFTSDSYFEKSLQINPDLTSATGFFSEVSPSFSDEYFISSIIINDASSDQRDSCQLSTDIISSDCSSLSNLTPSSSMQMSVQHSNPISGPFSSSVDFFQSVSSSSSEPESVLSLASLSSTDLNSFIGTYSLDSIAPTFYTQLVAPSLTSASAEVATDGSQTSTHQNITPDQKLNSYITEINDQLTTTEIFQFAVQTTEHPSGQSSESIQTTDFDEHLTDTPFATKDTNRSTLPITPVTNMKYTPNKSSITDIFTTISGSTLGSLDSTTYQHESNKIATTQDGSSKTSASSIISDQFTNLDRETKSILNPVSNLPVSTSPNAISDTLIGSTPTALSELKTELFSKPHPPTPSEITTNTLQESNESVVTTLPATGTMDNTNSDQITNAYESISKTTESLMNGPYQLTSSSTKTVLKPTGSPFTIEHLASSSETTPIQSTDGLYDTSTDNFKTNSFTSTPSVYPPGTSSWIKTPKSEDLTSERIPTTIFKTSHSLFSNDQMSTITDSSVIGTQYHDHTTVDQMTTKGHGQDISTLNEQTHSDKVSYRVSSTGEITSFHTTIETQSTPYWTNPTNSPNFPDKTTFTIETNIETTADQDTKYLPVSTTVQIPIKLIATLNNDQSVSTSNSEVSDAFTRKRDPGLTTDQLTSTKHNIMTAQTVNNDNQDKTFTDQITTTPDQFKSSQHKTSTFSQQQTSSAAQTNSVFQGLLNVTETSRSFVQNIPVTTESVNSPFAGDKTSNEANKYSTTVDQSLTNTHENIISSDSPDNRDQLTNKPSQNTIGNAWFSSIENKAFGSPSTQEYLTTDTNAVSFKSTESSHQIFSNMDQTSNSDETKIYGAERTTTDMKKNSDIQTGTNEYNTVEISTLTIPTSKSTKESIQSTQHDRSSLRFTELLDQGTINTISLDIPKGNTYSVNQPADVSGSSSDKVSYGISYESSTSSLKTDDSTSQEIPYTIPHHTLTEDSTLSSTHTITSRMSQSVITKDSHLTTNTYTENTEQTISEYQSTDKIPKDVTSGTTSMSTNHPLLSHTTENTVYQDTSQSIGTYIQIGNTQKDDTNPTVHTYAHGSNTPNTLTDVIFSRSNKDISTVYPPTTGNPEFKTAQTISSDQNTAQRIKSTPQALFVSDEMSSFSNQASSAEASSADYKTMHVVDLTAINTHQTLGSTTDGSSLQYSTIFDQITGSSSGEASSTELTTAVERRTTTNTDIIDTTSTPNTMTGTELQSESSSNYPRDITDKSKSSYFRSSQRSNEQTRGYASEELDKQTNSTTQATSTPYSHTSNPYLTTVDFQNMTAGKSGTDGYKFDQTTVNNTDNQNTTDNSSAKASTIKSPTSNIITQSSTIASTSGNIFAESSTSKQIIGSTYAHIFSSKLTTSKEYTQSSTSKSTSGYTSTQTTTTQIPARFGNTQTSILMPTTGNTYKQSFEQTSGKTYTQSSTSEPSMGSMKTQSSTSNPITGITYTENSTPESDNAYTRSSTSNSYMQNLSPTIGKTYTQSFASTSQTSSTDAGTPTSNPSASKTYTLTNTAANKTYTSNSALKSTTGKTYIQTSTTNPVAGVLPATGFIQSSTSNTPFDKTYIPSSVTKPAGNTYTQSTMTNQTPGNTYTQTATSQLTTYTQSSMPTQNNGNTYTESSPSIPNDGNTQSFTPTQTATRSPRTTSATNGNTVNKTSVLAQTTGKTESTIFTTQLITDKHSVESFSGESTTKGYSLSPVVPDVFTSSGTFTNKDGTTDNIYSDVTSEDENTIFMSSAMLEESTSDSSWVTRTASVGYIPVSTVSWHRTSANKQELTTTSGLVTNSQPTEMPTIDEVDFKTTTNDAQTPPSSVPSMIITSTQVTDVDECAVPLTCPQNSACINTVGSFKCVCNNGYKKTAGICQDVDECASGQHRCPMQSVCLNTAGSYLCNCKQGYSQQGNTCVDIDECLFLPCQEISTCVNTQGFYTCLCPLGYYQQDIHTCIAVKLYGGEIRIRTIGNNSALFDPQMNNETSPLRIDIQRRIQKAVFQNAQQIHIGKDYVGLRIGDIKAGSIVVNVYLYFKIQSNPGVNQVYSLLLDNVTSYQDALLGIDKVNSTVYDINECFNPELNDCSPNSNCNNTIGLYNCSCKPAYLDISLDTKNRPGRICEDINHSRQDPLQNLRITIPKLAYQIGETVNFTVMSSRGSHLTYSIDYGDGLLENATNPEVISFRTPMLFTHIYQIETIVVVKVTAWNNVNVTTASTPPIKLQTRLISLGLRCEKIHTASLSANSVPVRFVLFIVDASLLSVIRNFHVQWIVDGQYRQLNYVKELQANGTIMVEQTLNYGKHVIMVNSTNDVSFLLLKKNVTIDQSIEGMNLTLDRENVKPNEAVLLSISSDRGTNIELNIWSSDGQVRFVKLNNLNPGPNSFNYSLLFQNVGSYSLEITGSNSRGNMTVKNSNPIRVMNPIGGGLVLYTNTPIRIPKQNLTLNISYPKMHDPPTNVTCEVFINGGKYLTNEFALQISSSKPLIIVSTWKDPTLIGNISLFVNCSNLLSTQLFSRNITVQVGIQGVNVTANKYFVPVNDSITLTFSFTAGSHFSFEYTIKGQVHGHRRNVAVAGTSTFQFNKTHSFVSPGFYEVNFLVKNLVSSQNKTITIGVLERVTGLTLTHYYSLSDINTKLNYGHGDLNNTFPLERNVTIVANTTSGNGLIYGWDLGKNVFLLTNTGILSYRFQVAGTYVVSVNASNALYHDVVSLSIVVQQIIEFESLTNTGPTNAYLPISFNLTLSQTGTESCFAWDMADGSPLIIYGDNHCLSNYSKHTILNYVRWTPSRNLIHNYTYTVNNTFLVSVEGYNLVSRRRIQQMAVISGISCDYPVVRIIGAEHYVNKRTHHLRSGWISLESTADVNCQVTSDAAYIWKAERVQPGDTYLDKVYNPYKAQSVSSDKFKVMFKPLTFAIGLYRISLNVSMKGIKGLHSNDFTYLAVDPSPLVAVIHGGNVRRVGYGSYLTLDASDSYDPDEHGTGRTAGLKFAWICKGSNQGPIDTAKILALNSTTPRINITKMLNHSSNVTSRGSCFGYPIVVLETTDATFSLDSKIPGENTTSIFQLVILKGNRVSTYEQAVGIVDGIPHTLTIRCVINCKSKVNPSGEFSLMGSCLTCTLQDKVRYTWSLLLKSSSNDTFSVIKDLNSLCTTGTKSSSLAFKKKVLVGGRVYRLHLEAHVPGYINSITAYEFKTNRPPYGGNCSISPLSGYALSTKFVVQCLGWMNHGEENSKGTGLLYRFYSQPRGGSEVQLLYYGTDPFMLDAKFGVGIAQYNYMFNVGVQISNPIGEYVEKRLEVQVKNPAMDKSSFFNQSDAYEHKFSSLLSSGRDQEAKQLIVALASLINTDPYIIEPKEATSASNYSNNATEFYNSSTTIDTSATKQKIQLRTYAVEMLAKTSQPNNLDSLQQTAMAFRVITLEPSQLSEKAQTITILAMENMANTMQKMVDESRDQNPTQKVTAGEDIIASLGNVLLSVDLKMNAASKDVDDDEEGEEEEEEGGIKEDSGQSIEPELGGEEQAQSSSLSDQWTPMNPNTTNMVRNLTNSAFKVADQVTRTILANRIPGEPATVLKSKLFTIVADRRTPENLNNSILASGSMKLPPVEELISSVDHQQFIDTKVLRVISNPFQWVPSAQHIKSNVLSLDLYGSDGKEIKVFNLSKDITIDLEVNHDAPLTLVTPNSTLNESMSMHSLTIPSSENSLQLVIRPFLENVTLDIFIRYRLRPTETDYDEHFRLPLEKPIDGTLSNRDYTIFISPEKIKLWGSGLYFIGVRQFSNDTSSLVFDYYDTLDQDLATVPHTPPAKVNALPSYYIQFIILGCRYWNVTQEQWLTDGCRVISESTTHSTRCLCNHLTSFGAEFFVPPNQINFDTVFLNLDTKLKNNHAVLIMLCLVFVIYVALVVWARRKDKQDVLRWGVVPLKSNASGDSYYYQITVYTGMRKGAGTKSRIGFVLVGDYADSGVRQLTDDKNSKDFGRGSINTFLLAVPSSFGPLTYLQIWHDGSGKGGDQSWYLRKILVKDLQTSRTSFFLCNRWLAVEKDDGMVERIIPVAADEEITTFRNLFFSKTHKSFSDSHLWLSVFMRPSRSNFTRVQRISCILSLVMLTMLSNALFFKAEVDNVDTVHGFTIGPLSFTLQSLFISFASCMIVLPVNIIIDQLFRKSRPKYNEVNSVWPITPTPQSSATPLDNTRSKTPDNLLDLESDYDYEERQEAPTRALSANAGFNQILSNSAIMSLWHIGLRMEASQSDLTTRDVRISSSLSFTSNLSRGSPKIGNWTSSLPLPPPTSNTGTYKKAPLPHFCVYLGWLLVFISTATSAFFTFSFSMQWGREISNAWLTAMLLSIGQSVTVIQPTKIIILALIVSLLIKKPDEDDDDDDDDDNVGGSQSASPPDANNGKRVQIVTDLKPDEELICCEPTQRDDPSKSVFTPDKSLLAKMRETRLKEMKINQLIKEIIFYVFYLILLTIVACNNQDPRTYLMKNTLVKVLRADYLPKIIGPQQFWNWTNVTLLPHTYTASLQNGEPAKRGDYRILTSGIGYRVGPVRLRQLRVKSGDCSPAKSLQGLITNCNKDYSFENEDDKNYDVKWQTLPPNASAVNQASNSAWRFRHHSEIGGMPMMGKRGLYSSSGYCKDLTGGPSRARDIVETLIKDRWIDDKTRAIFVEFTIYNPNVNMFCSVVLLFEMASFGGMTSNVFIHTYRLFPYVGGYGIFILVTEISCLFFIAFFVEQEVQTFRQMKMKCFKSCWNVLQALNLSASLVAVAMYAMRHLMTSSAINMVKRLKGEFYNFQRLAFWSDTFSVILAISVFLSTLKLIHLLRFNRRMSMLSQTLRHAAKDLSAFSMVFFVAFFSYACLGYLLFGTVTAAYASIISSLETLFMFALGKYHYNTLRTANCILGPIYFFSYTMLITFILLNVFVTILNDSFALVRSNISKQANDYEVVSFILCRFKEWLGIDFEHIFVNVKKKTLDEHEDDNNELDSVEEISGDIMNNIDVQVNDIFDRLNMLYQRLHQESRGLQNPVKIFPGA